MNKLNPGFTVGTHRVVSPQETLDRITPLLHKCGVTRCADVTQLDSLGVPTFCAIRPTGRVLQLSNGKGLFPVSAKVSALMEAIEYYHAENPLPDALVRASVRTMRAEGRRILDPVEIGGLIDSCCSEDAVYDWIKGEDLIDHSNVWAPAATAYFLDHSPLISPTHSNGLASGNHVVEATLHSLYELIERDAGSKLSVTGKIDLLNNCRVVDSATVEEESLRETIDRIEASGTKMVLLSLPSCVPVFTFCAFLLNKRPFANVSTLNFGWGTHWDKAVGAARAITEACQSRLTFIHGAREDILDKSVYRVGDVQGSRAYQLLDSIKPNLNWSDAVLDRDSLGDDLFSIYEYIVDQLVAAGHRQLYRFELTQPDIGVAVVKLITPTLQFNMKLFQNSITVLAYATI